MQHDEIDRRLAQFEAGVINLQYTMGELAREATDLRRTLEDLCRTLEEREANNRSPSADGVLLEDATLFP